MYLKFANQIFHIRAPAIDILPEANPNYAGFICFDNWVSKANFAEFDVNYAINNFEIASAKYTEVPGPVMNSWRLWKGSDDYIFHQKYHRGQYPAWFLQFDRCLSQIRVYSPEEFVLSATNGVKTVKNIFHYPLDQLMLMHHLLDRSGVLLHSSGIKIQGKGFVFPGISGTGKSTIVKLLTDQKIGIGLSDERTIIKELPLGIRIFGTPWASSAKIVNSEDAPLHAIIFVKRGDACPVIKRVSVAKAIEKILKVASVPWYDQEFVRLAFNVIEKLVSKVPAFEFSYKPSTEAAYAFQEFVSSSNV